MHIDKFIYNYQYYYYYDLKNINPNYVDFINDNLKNIPKEIEGKCVYCNEGYFLNSNGDCVELTLSNCKLNEMIDNTQLYGKCSRLCSENEFPFILLDLSDISNIKEYYSNFQEYNLNIQGYFSIDQAMYILSNKFIINYIKLNSVPLCIDIYEKQFQNLKNCAKVLFPKENGKYICQSCLEGYILDNQTNSCNEMKANCEYENVGTVENPIYSCTKCYNKNQNDYILVNEDNINFCEEKNNVGLEYCLEAEANTTFIRTKYNCKSCVINHLPYKSSFFERTICHNIFEDIIRNKSLDINNFSLITENETANNGICQSMFFTPDGIYCYSCTDKIVGMPGCKGSCTFSLERNDPIKCNECKEGYIESSEGVCESCDAINEGCNKCHYETSYPDDYIGIKRKRRFVCDNDCKNDYFLDNEDKLCKHCSEYLPKCVNCEKNDQIKCNKCEIGYYLINNECM